MPRPLARFALSLLTGWLILMSSHAYAALSINQAISRTGFTHAAISPDGKHVAMIGWSETSANLVLLDADTGQSRVLSEGKRIRTNNSRQLNRFDSMTKPLVNVIWAGNDLLVVDYQTHIESMALDGRLVSTLVENELGTHIVGKADPDQPDSTMVLVSGSSIWLADARTGKRTEFTIRDSDIPENSKIIHTAHDKQGHIRAVSVVNGKPGQDAGSISNWYKSSNTGKWQKLAEFNLADHYWLPEFIPDQEHALVVRSNIGRDTWAIFHYDTQKREMTEMLAGHPTQDIDTVDGVGQGTFKRVTTSAMLPQQVWFDAKWARLQAGIDQALPKRINVLSGNVDKRVLIHSYADVDPGTWYLFDVAQSSLREVARVKTAIAPEQMQPVTTISYPSRDGMTIPAYLTRPGSHATPQPAIIFLHDGPMGRSHWRWDSSVQLLASQGYVVLQPQFRGSGGFGKKFLNAGINTWNAAVQDDINAGVEHLVKQGIADPKRICVYGVGYGAYGAIWSLIKSSQLYRCGFTDASVPDLELLMEKNLGHGLGKFSVAIVSNRPDEDKKPGKTPAPAGQGSLAYLTLYDDDYLPIPFAQGQNPLLSLGQNKRSLEWTIQDVPNENVGRQASRFGEYRQHFYETMLTFLAKHLGAGAAPAKPPATAPQS